MNPQDLLLALLQGLFEWWPISSSGVYILVAKLFGVGIRTGYVSVLALHIASGLAVLTLLYKPALKLTWEFVSFRWSRFLQGYLVSLTASLVIGVPLYLAYVSIAESIGSLALALIGVGLLATSLVLFYRGRGMGWRREITLRDWVIVGLLQGLAVLPGFSRSGLTMGYLCIMGYAAETCVEVSFLLAIPVLIAAGAYNLLQIHGWSLIDLTVELAVVYFVGLGSAKLLLEAARRIKFYYFTLLLGILALLGAVLQLIT